MIRFPLSFGFFLATALSLATSLPCQVVYVDASATGANTGTSWADAYTDLQPALQATSSGEIWVAEGTYFAGPAGNQAATFQLANGVELYGGFAGNETQRSQRDVAAHVVTLSGDIDHNDSYNTGPQWWRYGWNGNSGNSWHIVTGSGTDATAVLDGFRLFAGRAADPANHAGGGLFIDGGSPTIRNCTIQYCGLGYGSSAWLNDCNSRFENCVIRDGYTCNCGFGGWVSGMLVYGVSNVTFIDCEFLNHYYVSSQSQGRGAALRIDFNCSATLTGCRFADNQTGNFYPMGGGTAMGAAINSAGALTIDRCEFVDNFAHAGSGIAASGPLTLTNSLFARNLAVPHPENSFLTYGDYGAGVLLWGWSNSVVPVTIANCTFVDNYCDKGAGICNYGASTAVVRNCIVYHNDGPPPAPGETPVWILKRQIVGALDLEHCCVQALFETEPNEDPPDALNFPGCFDVPPRFVDWQGGNYHLLPESPSRNTGDGAAIAGLIEDLEGNARVVGLVDMGCYEAADLATPSMHSFNLVQDWDADFTVVNANPNEPVFFLYSFSGVGAGPCLPAPATLCAQILPPIGLLDWIAADGTGKATVTWHVPPAAPLITLHFQGLIVRGPYGAQSVGTNTRSLTINPTP